MTHVSPQFQATSANTTTIERDSHSQQFVIVHNHVARDKRLPRACRGLLIEVLSLAPGTAITPETLAEGGPEGRDALRSMISKLEQYGYVIREKGQDARGRWYTRLIFRETPVENPPPLPVENPPPTPGFPSSVPPAETAVFPAHTDDGFSGVGLPGAKDLNTKFKDEDQNQAGERSATEPAADRGLASSMTDLISSEMKTSTGKTIDAATARRIGAELIGRVSQPPQNIAGYLRACIRNEANAARWLPTHQPPPVRDVLTWRPTEETQGAPRTGTLDMAELKVRLAAVAASSKYATV